MVDLTLGIGNLVVKIAYILSLVLAIIGGIVSMFIVGFFAGLGIVVFGTLGVIMSYYILFLIIDMHAQLVKLNEKR